MQCRCLLFYALSMEESVRVENNQLSDEEIERILAKSDSTWAEIRKALQSADMGNLKILDRVLQSGKLSPVDQAIVQIIHEIVKQNSMSNQLLGSICETNSNFREAIGLITELIMRLSTSNSPREFDLRKLSKTLKSVENKQKLKLSTELNLHIHGDNFGNVNQIIENKFSLNERIDTAFADAERIVASKNIPLEQKKTINTDLGLLKDQLKKEEKDLTKIQQTWKRLKKNASWLIPTTAQVVSDVIKTALGLP
jgi:hypothetical protein